MNEDQNNLYYMNRRELKEVAKDRLRQPGVRQKMLIAMIIPTLIMVFFVYWNYTQPDVSTAISNLSSNSEIIQASMNQMTSSVRMNYLQQFLMLYFMTGVSFGALDLIRNRDHEFTASSMILRCFNSRYFWSVLLVAILSKVAITIGIMLVIVPGILLTYGLRFIMLVLYDARERGERTDLFYVLAQSYRITRGYKFDLFVLDLSFIGWSLLVGITAGIANLWVEPYIQLTTAAFYEQLRMRYDEAHPTEVE